MPYYHNAKGICWMLKNILVFIQQKTIMWGAYYPVSQKKVANVRNFTSESRLHRFLSSKNVQKWFLQRYNISQCHLVSLIGIATVAGMCFWEKWQNGLSQMKSWWRFMSWMIDILSDLHVHVTLGGIFPFTITILPSHIFSLYVS